MNTCELGWPTRWKRRELVTCKRYAIQVDQARQKAILIRTRSGKDRGLTDEGESKYFIIDSRVVGTRNCLRWQSRPSSRSCSTTSVLLSGGCIWYRYALITSSSQLYRAVQRGRCAASPTLSVAHSCRLCPVDIRDGCFPSQGLWDWRASRWCVVELWFCFRAN